MKYRLLNYFLLFCAYFLCFVSFSQPPSKIELVNANTLEYDETSAGKIKRLIGNVIFKQDAVFLYCDSAYFHTEKNQIEAFGNVHIQQGDSLNLLAEMLQYNGNTKQAELFRKIRMSDSQMTLTTEQLHYDLNNRVAEYTANGKIVDKENTLTSRMGYYFSANKEVFFKDDVVLVNPDYEMYSDTLKYNTFSKTAYFLGPTVIRGKDASLIYCKNGWYNTEKEFSQFGNGAFLQSGAQKLTGDSMVFDRKKGTGKAFENVELTDTLQHIIINGNYGEYHQETDSVIITGNTMMTQIFDDDPMFLHADTLMTYTILNPKSQIPNSKPEIKNLETDTQRVLLAFHHVKFFKSDLQGKCDSLTYSFTDSLIRLYTAPVLWSNENQLTADFISIQVSNEKIEKFNLNNNSFITSQVDSARFNQVRGKNMTGYFYDNELYKIYVDGNGQTIYYAKDKQEKLIGVNRAECSNLMLFVSNNSVKKITLDNKPGATFYPVTELQQQERFLKGFSWKIKNRPARKEDIFVW